MKHPLPSLDALKVFECAARHLSFSQAAEELCLSKGAVSYQIRRLEHQLECTLFRRAVRQVYLTEAGQTLFRATQDMFADLSVTLRRISNNAYQQIVLASTTYVASRWLSSRVAQFLERHPETAIRFNHNFDEKADGQREYDIAVVWGHCDGDSHPDCIRQLPMPLFPVCSPDLAQRINAGTLEIHAARLLSESRQKDLWLDWFEMDILPNPRQIIQDANVRVQAAIDGQGLILADQMMAPELDSGALVRISDRQLDGYGYLIKSPANRRKRSLVSTLLSWLET